jgi:hypothetical protein
MVVVVHEKVPVRPDRNQRAHRRPSLVGRAVGVVRCDQRERTSTRPAEAVVVVVVVAARAGM